MTTEKQLTVADLKKLPPEISVRSIARRARVNEDTLNSKIYRRRKGKADALTPEQSQALVRALRGIVEEIEAVIGPV